MAYRPATGEPSGQRLEFFQGRRDCDASRAFSGRSFPIAHFSAEQALPGGAEAVSYESVPNIAETIPPDNFRANHRIPVMQSINKSQCQPMPVASGSSIFGLDLLTFLMADVRDGVGPYLSVFLKGGLHWQSGEIGIAMATSSVTAVICQIPAGLLVDSVHAKRLLVVISGLMVSLGCLLVVCVPKLIVVVSAQAALGAASAVIPPALAALSLGIVGRKLFPSRVSRNESFNHAGNFAAAILAGTIGQRLGYHWIFYLVCLFAL